MADAEKQCPGCLETKPLLAFYTKNKKTTNLCKTCIKKQRIEGLDRKHCPSCKQFKPITEFNIHPARGHQYSCKLCAAERSREVRREAKQPKPKLGELDMALCGQFLTQPISTTWRVGI